MSDAHGEILTARAVERKLNAYRSAAYETAEAARAEVERSHEALRARVAALEAAGRALTALLTEARDDDTAGENGNPFGIPPPLGRALRTAHDALLAALGPEEGK